jgi:putative ABC transport system substrate-binding protein
VLSGTPVGQLPVVQASRFELVINVPAARAIGLTVPERLLARADELIE